MKTAEIAKITNRRGKTDYDFELFFDGQIIATSYDYYLSKDECIQVLKNHFSDFGIVDKTEEG